LNDWLIDSLSYKFSSVADSSNYYYYYYYY